ncbi:MAG: pyocin activator PrtN family protein [Hyphomicrobiales bacterium]|nr:pyocin activator PrtN family protein [Hyphomicrobiales bacterium]
MNSAFFGLLAEFGEACIPLDRVAPKYFGLSCAEARRRALAKQLPCRAFRLGPPRDAGPSSERPSDG